MKNLKKLLLVAIATLSFVACGDKKDDKKEQNEQTLTENVSNWQGTLILIPAVSELDNLEVKTTCSNAKKTCKIEMKQVKFAQQMPYKLDIIIDNVSFSVNKGDTILTGADIESQYIKEGQLKEAGYKVNTIRGKIKNGKIYFDVEGKYKMMQMDISFNYNGVRK